MSKWRTYKLGELVTIKGGKRLPKGVLLQSAPNHHPYIRIRDLGKTRILELDSTYEYVDDITQKSIARYVVEKGDILLSIVGTIGLIGIVGESLHLANQTENCVKLINLKTVDRLYLYYYLSSTIGQIEIQKGIVGAVQAKLPIKNIENIEISLPPLTEQKRIADILSAIDDKIELNRRINANLEQQAQALYKSWFVDFEFPNEEGKPYKSSGGKMQESELGLIPKGWNIDKLGNKVVIKRGGSPRPIQDFLALKGFRWLKISDATAEPSPYIYKIKEFIKEEGLSKTVFLNKGELVLSNSATPGLPKLLGLDTCIHDGWLYFPKSDFSKEYLFELFLFEREKILSQANGSVFSNLKTDILKALTIIVPQENVLNRFQNIIGQIFRSIQQKQEEIISLTTLRDTLLPKLMSGEIKV